MVEIRRDTAGGIDQASFTMPAERLAAMIAAVGEAPPQATAGRGYRATMGVLRESDGTAWAWAASAAKGSAWRGSIVQPLDEANAGNTPTAQDAATAGPFDRGPILHALRTGAHDPEGNVRAVIEQPGNAVLGAVRVEVPAETTRTVTRTRIRDNPPHGVAGAGPEHTAEAACGVSIDAFRSDHRWEAPAAELGRAIRELLTAAEWKPRGGSSHFYQKIVEIAQAEQGAAAWYREVKARGGSPLTLAIRLADSAAATEPSVTVRMTPEDARDLATLIEYAARSGEVIDLYGGGTDEPEARAVAIIREATGGAPVACASWAEPTDDVAGYPPTAPQGGARLLDRRAARDAVTAACGPKEWAGDLRADLQDGDGNAYFTSSEGDDTGCAARTACENTPTQGTLKRRDARRAFNHVATGGTGPITIDTRSEGQWLLGDSERWASLPAKTITEDVGTNWRHDTPQSRLKATATTTREQQ